MRVRYRYLMLLLECKMLKKAIHECEEMLKLCENDNLGVRYILIHLYTFWEDEKSVLNLCKKLKMLKTTQLLFPLSVLYYKLLDFKKAEKYLLELAETNRYTKEFFEAFLEERIDEFELEDYGYKPFTIDELIVTFIENLYLYCNLIEYFSWGYDILKKKR